MYMSACTHFAMMAFECVKLHYDSGKLSGRRQLAKLMEQLDICQHAHCCVCNCSTVHQDCLADTVVTLPKDSISVQHGGTE